MAKRCLCNELYRQRVLAKEIHSSWNLHIVQRNCIRSSEKILNSLLSFAVHSILVDIKAFLRENIDCKSHSFFYLKIESTLKSFIFLFKSRKYIEITSKQHLCLLKKTTKNPFLTNSKFPNILCGT